MEDSKALGDIWDEFVQIFSFVSRTLVFLETGSNDVAADAKEFFG